MATSTAAARREEARFAYDAFLKECPTGQLLARISDKWVGLIVSALGEADDRSLRYSDLGRKIPGVSQKMLTQTLRSLERDGLVTRHVTPTVPVRVDYRLTDLGSSLGCLLSSVKTWAENHFDEVSTHRDTYDRANAAS
ncbi:MULTISPECIES: winged helix-turn-helix transcriptional regulator [Streptomyces]|uniref:winged helix-turn-helix transcriptional regulator n=1 Tax=Streptomyces TaxID=1883 RepID=UPI0004BDFC74|nr:MULTISPECIES: helix-turn-helix domain-containing protein [Streptomyces]KJY16855.1 HxlR family transcriptional regulator [Streptomyces sp. NRRL S-104]KOU32975.1 HxlR family transcriptional regulator [Streptomyces sp. WM6373]KOU64669.1 HxlR family transcriptional regulator [Streptomyces sp. IGB124]KOU73524.1 HxlR family transcriptional regulator [Streptomyces sp. XY66]KOU78646.1 HxlR family transcriptional regulator [Streptomyces sp. XY58]